MVEFPPKAREITAAGGSVRQAGVRQRLPRLRVTEIWSQRKLKNHWDSEYMPGAAVSGGFGGGAGQGRTVSDGHSAVKQVEAGNSISVPRLVSNGPVHLRPTFGLPVAME